MWVIKIKTNDGHDCFYCEKVEGDPGRTTKVENATTFSGLWKAKLVYEKLSHQYPKRKFWPQQI